MKRISETGSPARILVATGILLAGLLLLLKNTVAVSPPPPRESHHEISAAVEQALNPERFRARPTLDDLPDVYEEVESQVVSEARQIAVVSQRGEECLADLGTAFVERLRFMLLPEPRRDYEAIAARGDPRDFSAWANRFESYLAARDSRRELPALDASGIEVSQVTQDRDGEQSARTRRFSEGFGITTGKGVQFRGVSGSPLSDGMLVVEVVIPMERTELKSGQYTEAIQGYHFTWNPQTKEWIPYESVVYKRVGDTFVPPPL